MKNWTFCWTRNDMLSYVGCAAEPLLSVRDLKDLTCMLRSAASCITLNHSGCQLVCTFIHAASRQQTGTLTRTYQAICYLIGMPSLLVCNLCSISTQHIVSKGLQWVPKRLRWLTSLHATQSGTHPSAIRHKMCLLAPNSGVDKRPHTAGRGSHTNITFPIPPHVVQHTGR